MTLPRPACRPSPAQFVIEVLKNPNKWYRQTALRIFHDRHDANLVPKLKKLGFIYNPSLDSSKATLDLSRWEFAVQTKRSTTSRTCRRWANAWLGAAGQAR